ncbi:ATP synthase F1 subunit gamma [Acidobacteria bacterium AH-259-L09]|nr:ATP synthase F1 subunit gamma [Acidobacteria bacterium AH-259-L09]
MPGANLRDVRRRVRSVKNIQQITRAMKFVAASKLRRAQERIFSARPYASRMLAVLNSVATRVDPAHHPLLVERHTDKIMLLVITADRGLCGAFNANIVRAAAKHIEDESTNKTISLTLVGRKGAEWFRRRPWPIRHEYVNIMSKVDFKYAQEIARSIIDYYAASELDAVYLAYNEFKSVIQQRVVVEPLLPIRRLETEQQAPVLLDYIYEQPPPIIFDHLLPRHVETQVFRAMLESEAAEHGARMTAMDSATRNAKEMIEKLTLHMNRIRQASITTEIIEIVSGADALKVARG